MVITYHGGQCFKLVHGETVVAFDPISKEKGATFTPVRFGADVVVSSLHHPNFSGVSQLQSGQKSPFVVAGPGEYEIDEITIRGFGVSTVYGGEEKFATIYQMQFEGMNIVFLGPIATPDIDPKILGALSDIDILFVPIGDGEVLSPPQASKLAVKLEAKVVIPMHYDKAALNAFLKEEGTTVSPQEKLTVKPKDVAQMSGEVVVLEPK